MSSDPSQPSLDGLAAYVRSLARDLCPGAAPLRVRVDFDNGETLQLPIPRPPPLAENQASPDFREVRWFGRTYHFTPMQAAIVRELWAAYHKGAPEMGQATLLEAAGSVGRKVMDLFKGHEARADWMIGPGEGKGTFRLYSPEEAAAV